MSNQTKPSKQKSVSSPDSLRTASQVTYQVSRSSMVPTYPYGHTFSQPSKAETCTIIAAIFAETPTKAKNKISERYPKDLVDISFLEVKRLVCYGCGCAGCSMCSTYDTKPEEA